MSTIYEVLEQYFPENFMDYLQKHQQWINLLRQIDKPGEIGAYLLDIVEIFASGRYCSVWEFGQILEHIGIDIRNTDVNNLIRFLETAKTLNIKFDKLNRFKPVDLYEQFKDRLESLDSSQVIQLIKDSGLVTKNTSIRVADKSYYLPKSKQTLKDIIKLFHGDELIYVSERRDCDDFAIMFKSFLSRNALGNLAVGIFWGKFKIQHEQTTDVFYHAVNLVMYRDETGNIQVELYEPQSELTIITERNLYSDIEGFFVMI